MSEYFLNKSIIELKEKHFEIVRLIDKQKGVERCDVCLKRISLLKLLILYLGEQRTKQDEQKRTVDDKHTRYDQ